ncbi:Pyrroline-5-carboxylate reductase (EC 1.5.1.2), partial [Pseudomonas sp. FEN]
EQDTYCLYRRRQHGRQPDRRPAGQGPGSGADPRQRSGRRNPRAGPRRTRHRSVRRQCRSDPGRRRGGPGGQAASHESRLRGLAPEPGGESAGGVDCRRDHLRQPGPVARGPADRAVHAQYPGAIAPGRQRPVRHRTGIRRAARAGRGTVIGRGPCPLAGRGAATGRGHGCFRQRPGVLLPVDRSHDRCRRKARPAPCNRGAADLADGPGRRPHGGLQRRRRRRAAPSRHFARRYHGSGDQGVPGRRLRSPGRKGARRRRPSFGRNGRATRSV